METICAMWGKVHFAYFVQCDQNGGITKHLTYHISMWHSFAVAVAEGEIPSPVL